MPVLHEYSDQSGYYIKSHVSGAIVTFQLHQLGVKRLSRAGIIAGQTFPLQVLGELCRAGEAYTRRKGNRKAPGYYEAEQFEFAFAAVVETAALARENLASGMFASEG